MQIFDAVILGVVEGLTEFLPISSTAHLVITSRILDIPESTFLGSFIIAIQLGAIASLLHRYRQTIIGDFEAMKRVAAAFIPTAAVGFLAYELLRSFLLESITVIAWALLIGGVVLIGFERWYARVQQLTPTPLNRLPYGKAVLVGCAQALAIVPGVSRAGATIIGGLALGIGRKEIVEFSFLLAIPTMLAATGFDLLKTGGSFATDEWQLLAVGFIVSFIAASIAVRFLIRFVETNSFTMFGFYRIALGLLLLVFMV